MPDRKEKSTASAAAAPATSAASDAVAPAYSLFSIVLRLSALALGGRFGADNGLIPDWPGTALAIAATALRRILTLALAPPFMGRQRHHRRSYHGFRVVGTRTV